MDTSLRTSLVIGLAAVLLVACGGAVDSGGSPGEDGGGGSDVTELDGQWRLTAGTGADGDIVAPDDPPVTLSIEGDQWGGSAHCNSYGGTVTVAGDAVTIGDLARTEMACMDADLMAAEDRFFTAMAAVEQLTIGDGGLTLTGPDTSLAFARVPPVEDVAIVGTSWVLDSLISSTGPDGGVSSTQEGGELLLAEDGSLSGSTGCNRLMGSYELDGSTLRLGQLATTRMACDGMLAEQEQHVLAVLDGDVEATVVGDRLTIEGPDGRALSFTAAG